MLLLLFLLHDVFICNQSFFIFWIMVPVLEMRVAWPQTCCDSTYQTYCMSLYLYSIQSLYLQLWSHFLWTWPPENNGLKKKTMYFIKCCSFNNRFNHNLIINNRFFRAGHLHRTCKVTQAVVIIIAAHRFLRGVHKQRAQILVWPCHGQQQTRNQKLLQQFDLCERTKQSALSVM